MPSDLSYLPQAVADMVENYGSNIRLALVEELEAEHAIFVEDGNHGEYRPLQDEFVAHGVPFVRPGNLVDGHIDLSGCDRINEVAFQRVRKGIGKGGDIVLTTNATIGRVAITPMDATVFVTNPQTTVWRSTNAEILNQYYLFCFMRSLGFQEQLRMHTGRNATFDYVSLTKQRSLTIPIPPLAEQKAIAAVLGALDDKIELNRRMNATLEAMARALFQSWFVDFDPVRAKLDGGPPTGLDTATASLFPDSFQDSSLGRIPKGWEAGSILRQAVLLSGGTPKTDVPAYWNGDVPWASAKDVSQCGEAFLVTTERTITRQGVEESSTKIIPANATVVVARGATTGRLTMLGRTMAMNQTCYALRTKVEAPFALYCNARHFIERLVQGGHGSIFDTITTSTFEATNVLLATTEVLLAFDKQVTPLFQRAHANLHQSRTLATLRDTLLPKLLSGELSVSASRAFTKETL